MPKFRKRPVVIEAIRWDGTNHKEIVEFCGKADTGIGASEFRDGQECLRIHTLEGVMRASPGDWIIKGVKGEFYPCRDDIFEATYASLLEAEATQAVIHVRPAVRAFAWLMESQLRANDHKGGWSDCDLLWLAHRARQETAELIAAVAHGTPAEVGHEAADVANFAMMVADRAGQPGLSRAALARPSTAGTPISRSDALRISRATLETAERERADAAALPAEAQAELDATVPTLQDYVERWFATLPEVPESVKAEMDTMVADALADLRRRNASAERVKRLEAVAEAARVLQSCSPHYEWAGQHQALQSALDALAASGGQEVEGC